MSEIEEKEPLIGIGIDLGGTNIRIGIIDQLGRVLGVHHFKTPEESIEALLSNIDSWIAKSLKDLGIARKNLKCISIGIPGVVNPSTGIIQDAPNVRYLNGLNGINVFEEKFKVPIHLENDVNFAAIAEMHASGSKDFAFIAIGTGIGMGLVLNGQIRRGKNGGAGEIASIPMGSELDLTSGVTCLEDLVGGASLEERFQQETGNLKSFEEIMKSAKMGDADSISIVNCLVINVAQAIDTIQSILDLEEIVFGGGIGSKMELANKIEPLLSCHNPPKLRLSTLTSQAGLEGAMENARTHLRGEE
jgi:predicted NBD/HSP70 family sugar kinase